MSANPMQRQGRMFAFCDHGIDDRPGPELHEPGFELLRDPVVVEARVNAAR
jgi:hypothetical protein